MRSGIKSRLNSSTPVLPIEDNNDFDFDFENCRSALTKGIVLTVETADGKKTTSKPFIYNVTFGAMKGHNMT